MVTLPLQTKVFKIFENLIPANTKTLIIAVSGGADSMALVLLVHEYAAAHGLNIIAVTVDHKLRYESSDEAAWVHQTLSDLSIEHQTLVWTHEGLPNRLHERARKARYQLLLDFCKNYENSVLLTAHHQQDQVETVLMRFLKGSGAAGFKGIQPKRVQNTVPIVRPLLEIDPKDLRHFLIQKNINWVEDPSNDNLKYERTRIRQLLQHINKDWGVGGILESATKITETQTALDQVISEYEQRFLESVLNEDTESSSRSYDSPQHDYGAMLTYECITPDNIDALRLDRGDHKINHNLEVYGLIINQTEFFKCPTQIQRQWLRHKIWQIGVSTYPKPYKTIDAILRMLKQPKVNRYQVAGCEIAAAKKKIHIKKSSYLQERDDLTKNL